MSEIERRLADLRRQKSELLVQVRNIEQEIEHLKYQQSRGEGAK